MAEFTEVWERDLTGTETEALIDKAAREICRRKLQTPAILMLEMHKPLAGVLGQAAVVSAPFIIPFLGFDSFNDYSRLLSKRENVELLLLRLEELCKTPLEGDPSR